MDAEARMAAVREEIAGLAEEFARAAEAALGGSLAAAIERFVVERAGWFNALKTDDAAAFRRAARDAIAHGARLVADRLRDPNLWLEPTVYVDQEPGHDLDDPNNRAWVALLTAARPLDPVLEEFGLSHDGEARPGGARFGLQPQTLGELDPSGRLRGIWGRYRQAFGRYRTLAREPDERRRERERDEAQRRWREIE